MFNCELCKKTSYRKQQKVVIEMRNVKYLLQLKIVRGETHYDENNEPQSTETITYRKLRPRYGSEIAKELKLCQDCAKKFESKEPKYIGNIEKTIIVKTLINPKNFNKENRSKFKRNKNKGEKGSGKFRKNNFTN